MKRFLGAAFCGAIWLGMPLSALGVTIDTVFVGDPGNAPNSLGYGRVDYAYRMGTYEVTNDQYAEFLNAKAKSDPLGLYNTEMASAASRGGIIRDGSSGSYEYTVRENMGNKPVNWVSFRDALRFANWMHNGQGDGDTETGAYTLGNLSITRNPGAIWFLPTDDEWLKAASYDPRTTAEGGPPDDSHYWKYATQNNNLPAIATADSVGNISNPGPNVANRSVGADWDGLNGNLTTAGSAGPLSTSYYGTYDQNGNVNEWNFLANGAFNFRGGDFASLTLLLDLSTTPPGPALLPGSGSSADLIFGFRLATVPEPSAVVLGAIATVGLLLVWKSRRAIRTR